MPFEADDLASRGAIPDEQFQEVSDVPVGDLLYLLAEGVAEAQSKLDLNTAEVMEVLAETEVDVVPSITRTVEEDGSVTIDSDDPVPQSLLALGFKPTRYQFSEATLEANFDLKITEESETESEEEGDTGGMFGLRAGTYELEKERKLNREVQANASVTATLQPVPVPIDLTPAEGYESGETDE